MTGVLQTARINTVEVVMSRDKLIKTVNVFLRIFFQLPPFSLITKHSRKRFQNFR